MKPKVTLYICYLTTDGIARTSETLPVWNLSPDENLSKIATELASEYAAFKTGETGVIHTVVRIEEF